MDKRYEREKANLAKLPPICFVMNDVDQTVVAIKAGVLGYYPLRADSFFHGRDVDEINAELGVTKKQAAAMKCGSLFGFDVPGADVDHYDDDGRLIGERIGQ